MGTGVDWILGAGTWLDVHTIDMVPSPCTAPDATNPAASATALSAQRGGLAGLSMREIPPPARVELQVPASTAQCTPAPSVTTAASKWAPLNPGAELRHCKSMPTTTARTCTSTVPSTCQTTM